MTLFDLIIEKGQTAVSTALGDPFHVVRVHRFFHVSHAKLDMELIERCAAVFDGFDRSGTLEEWYRRRSLVPKRPRRQAVASKATDAARKVASASVRSAA